MVQIGANSRHDPFGRKIAKTVKQGSQTKTTYYIYSEQGLMAEADEKGGGLHYKVQGLVSVSGTISKPWNTS